MRSPGIPSAAESSSLCSFALSSVCTSPPPAMINAAAAAGPEATDTSRISICLPHNLLVLPPTAAFVGLAIGMSRGGSSARLRFLAENAHRPPKTVQGWVRSAFKQFSSAAPPSLCPARFNAPTLTLFLAVLLHENPQLPRLLRRVQDGRALRPRTRRGGRGVLRAGRVGRVGAGAGAGAGRGRAGAAAAAATLARGRGWGQGCGSVCRGGRGGGREMVGLESGAGALGRRGDGGDDYGCWGGVCV